MYQSINQSINHINRFLHKLDNNNTFLSGDSGGMTSLWLRPVKCGGYQYRGLFRNKQIQVKNNENNE